MSDLRQRIEGDEGSFQRLAAYIPGFKGYRELGMRREADQILRMHLVQLLDDVLGQMQRVVQRWTEEGKLGVLETLDRLHGRMRKVRDGIRYADYGYTGWWDATKIKEEELDNMYEYDLQMREEIVQLDAAVQELLQAEEESLEEKQAVVEEHVAQLQHAVDHRGEVTAGLIP
jgi:hypothetical protein